MSRIMLATYFGAGALFTATAAFAPKTEIEKEGLGPVTEVAADFLPQISSMARVLAGTYGAVGLGMTALLATGTALENRDRRRRAGANLWGSRDDALKLYCTTLAMERFIIDVNESGRPDKSLEAERPVNVAQIVIGLNQGSGFQLAYLPNPKSSEVISPMVRYMRLFGLDDEPEPKSDVARGEEEWAYADVLKAKALAEKQGVRFHQLYGEWRAELPPLIH